MPVQGGLVNTRSGQERLPRQFLPNCTFSVGIVAMAQDRTCLGDHQVLTR